MEKISLEIVSFIGLMSAGFAAYISGQALGINNGLMVFCAIYSIAVGVTSLAGIIISVDKNYL